MNPLQKAPEETVIGWQLRIYRNRKLYDLNNQEIADLFNKETGIKKDESAWRKYMKAFNDGYEYAINNNISDEEALNELEMKRIELQEERKKLQTIRVDYNKLIREKSRRDLMFEHVKDSFESIPTPEIEFDVSNYVGKNNQTAILAFGDAHWGKVFESYWNEYSPEIFEKRMKQLAEETIAYCKKEGFTELEILSMGDSIEGMSLRISQLQSLRVGFIDQAISFAKYMAKWLSELSKHFNRIIYRQIVSANHSEIRPFNSSRNEFPAEDLEKVIVNYLHDVLEDNDRIEIPIYKDQIIEFDVLGSNHIATHGHAIKKSKNVLKDISFHRQKFFHTLWIAHFHHSDMLTVGENGNMNLDIIGIPSIIGSDTYSDSLLTGSKAGAIICTFEEGKGRRNTYNIVLD